VLHAASRPAGAERGASLSSLSTLVLRQSRRLAEDYALLAVLDARRATISLAWMLCTALVVAVLMVTAWLALITGAIVWLVRDSASWPVALGLGAGLNVNASVALFAWLRRFYKDPPFAATLRQLKGDPPREEES
jgi:uncharacterized membrane protein YqjE